MDAEQIQQDMRARRAAIDARLDLIAHLEHLTGVFHAIPRNVGST